MFRAYAQLRCENILHREKNLTKYLLSNDKKTALAWGLSTRRAGRRKEILWGPNINLSLLAMSLNIGLFKVANQTKLKVKN